MNLTDKKNHASALLKPGEANNFFLIEGLPDFDPSATHSFSRRNALWLMEFSRLIYRQNPMAGEDFKTRNAILAEQGRGWLESAFFDAKETEAALFVQEKMQCAALVFRGTAGFADLLTDFQHIGLPWQGNGFVHPGFKAALDSVWPEIKRALMECFGRGITRLFITGHSLGGALATLAAARCMHDAELHTPAALYTFGSPRVADRNFAQTLSGLFHCRVVNDTDMVPTVPPAFSVPFWPVYHHVGQLHRLTPESNIEMHEPDSDICGMRGTVEGIAELSRTIAGLVHLDGKSIIPKNLVDHIPQNYIARLERTPTRLDDPADGAELLRAVALHESQKQS